MKIFNLPKINLVLLIILSFTILNSPLTSQQINLSHPIEKTEIKDYRGQFYDSNAAEEKAKRVAEKLQLTPAQQEELTVVCEYILTHWEELMHQEIPNTQFISAKKLFGKTQLTVHPSAKEVCIYLEGHTKMLGQGAFKTVMKAISFTREEEVAVATPTDYSEYDDDTSTIFSPIYSSTSDFDSGYRDRSDSSSWYNSSTFTDTTSSDLDSTDWSGGGWRYNSSTVHDSTLSDLDISYWRDTYTNSSSGSDWICEDYVREARILEKVQDCPTVIQIYFISFDWKASKQEFSPTIVGKYYNGGTYANLSHKKDFDLETKLRICHDLLLALSHVHSLNICHNDIHSGNILLQKNNTPQNSIMGAYLSDFGLSKEYESQDDLNFRARSYWDTTSLAANLQKLFHNYYYDGELPNDLPAEELMLYQLLSQGSNPQVTSQNLYDEFMALLPELVDEETAERVTRNALTAKRIKIQQENYIEWQ